MPIPVSQITLYSLPLDRLSLLLCTSRRTYEATLLDVQSYMASIDVPIRSMQFDSWWYWKGPNKGVGGCVYGIGMIDGGQKLSVLGLHLDRSPAGHVVFAKTSLRLQALLLWEPMPSVFPDGMSTWLGLPLALHNRYFSGGCSSDVTLTCWSACSACRYD